MPAAIANALAGKAVIVTGASRGIGAAIARSAVDEGASLLAVSRSGRGEPLPGARRLAVDLRDDDAPRGVLESCLDAFGKVDCLVNNAGIIHHANCWEHPDEPWDEMFETNVTAPFRLSQQLVAHWLAAERSGVIVNITSIESEVAMPHQAGYAATKGGLLGLTRAMALELAPAGIRAVALAPGDIATEMASAANVLGRIPMARQGTVEEVANLAVFLLSDRAAYITGAMVAVDGGYLAQ
jgi:NAD(P)-dependent dehydrogenase (short-subunit alcohol dehydrogenase family)